MSSSVAAGSSGRSRRLVLRALICLGVLSLGVAWSKRDSLLAHWYGAQLKSDDPSVRADAATWLASRQMTSYLHELLAAIEADPEERAVWVTPTDLGGRSQRLTTLVVSPLLFALVSFGPEAAKLVPQSNDELPRRSGGAEVHEVARGLSASLVLVHRAWSQTSVDVKKGPRDEAWPEEVVLYRPKYLRPVN